MTFLTYTVIIVLEGGDKMTINERVKYIRKDFLKLNQTEFASQLGMKQTSVSTFEKNGATVTEQTIKTILLKYPMISEEWIRYEKGPMIISDVNMSLDDYVKSKGMTELETEILKLYLEIDPGIRKDLVEHFVKGLARFNSDESKYTFDNHEGIPDTPEEFEKLYPPEDDLPGKINDVG